MRQMVEEKIGGEALYAKTVEYRRIEEVCISVD